MISQIRYEEKEVFIKKKLDRHEFLASVPLVKFKMKLGLSNHYLAVVQKIFSHLRRITVIYVGLCYYALKFLLVFHFLIKFIECENVSYVKASPGVDI